MEKSVLISSIALITVALFISMIASGSLTGEALGKFNGYCHHGKGGEHFCSSTIETCEINRNPPGNSPCHLYD